MQTIEIAKDFSDVPAGRYRTDGDFSGESFRDDFLIPALENQEKVQVILDGAEGYGSSFLEEAFGGLVRNTDFDCDFINTHLVITCNNDAYRSYKEIAVEYMEEAFNEKKVA